MLLGVDVQLLTHRLDLFIVVLEGGGVSRTGEEYPWDDDVVARKAATVEHISNQCKGGGCRYTYYPIET
jgi:hypothetical protein